MRVVWFAVVAVLHLCAATDGPSSADGPSNVDNSSRADVSTSVANKNYSNADGTKLVCYYTPTSYFPAGRVPSNLCTHLIYAFGDISTNPPSIAAPSAGVASIWKTLTSLKHRNPQLKVLLSLQKGFPGLVGPSVSLMQQFAKNSVSYLRKYQFDGVDMDWEYPSSSQKNAYGKFFKIMREEINREASASRKPALLLSLALPNNQDVASTSYDLPTIAAVVDFATAMTYDFHVYNRRDTKTGYNSPLYTPRGEYTYLSASAMAKYYLSSGFPGPKLLLGIPAYGRSWKLASQSSHGLHSPAVGKGDPGPYRHLTGIYTYPDACVALRESASRVADLSAGAVYLYKGTNWVAYDDVTTVVKKCKWVMDNGLGGVGVWALHLDDLSGVCKESSLPLINAMKKAVHTFNNKLQIRDSGNRFKLSLEKTKQFRSNQDSQIGIQLPNVHTDQEPSTRNGMTPPESNPKWYDPKALEVNLLDPEKPRNQEPTNVKKVRLHTGDSEPTLEYRRHVFNNLVVPMESNDAETGKVQPADGNRENRNINNQNSMENTFVSMLKSVFKNLVAIFLNHFQGGPETSAE